MTFVLASAIIIFVGLVYVRLSFGEKFALQKTYTIKNANRIISSFYNITYLKTAPQNIQQQEYYDAEA